MDRESGAGGDDGSLKVLAAVYTALLAYGTLYPLWDWRWPAGGAWPLPSWPEQVSRADVVTNLFVYLPFGFLWAGVFHRRSRGAVGLAAVGLLGVALSLGLEFLQAFVPGRVPSLLDVALNGAGSVAGGGVAVLLGPGPGRSRWFAAWRGRWFLPGRAVDVALAVPALWALGQLFPLVPSVDVGSLRAGLRPLYHGLTGAAPFSPGAAAVYALQVAGLGGFVSLLARSAGRIQWVFAGCVAAVLVLKVPVVSRQLSLEAVIGAVAGYCVLLPVARVRYRLRAAAVAGFLVAAVVVDGLRSGPGGAFSPMVWVPFQAHVTNLQGLADVITGAWPWFALGWLGRAGIPARDPAVPAVLGAAGTAAIVLGIEFAQRAIPGRTPDVTDAVVAAAAWVLPWWVVTGGKTETGPPGSCGPGDRLS